MGKNLKVAGIAVGFTLYFTYVFLFSVLGSYLAYTYFSLPLIYISGPPMQWLIIGSVPLFITFGMYLFKNCERWEITGFFSGFILWLFVLLALSVVEFQLDDYGLYPALAGLLVMAGFYYLFKDRWCKK